MLRSLRHTGVAASAALLLLTACSSPNAGSGTAGERRPQSITVFAAASLERTFTKLGSWFEAEHPGTTVEFSFAGSSDLAAQIVAGAPADVFASADARTMTTLVDEDLVRGEPVDFASNRLEIAVPPDNPASITSLADLARGDVVTVVCAPQVPCGAATKTVEQAAGIRLTPASEELSVTDVLGKVSSGEADAGLVYVTDVLGAEGRVLGIAFPESVEAINAYRIAESTGSSDRALAKAFLAAVTGEPGQSLLADAGFGPPG